MAWRSSGRNHLELIKNMFTNGIIKSTSVRDAMLAVDRGHFAPRNPYTDSPMPIGSGATISAPV